MPTWLRVPVHITAQCQYYSITRKPPSHKEIFSLTSSEERWTGALCLLSPHRPGRRGSTGCGSCGRCSVLVGPHCPHGLFRGRYAMQAPAAQRCSAPCRTAPGRAQQSAGNLLVHGVLLKAPLLPTPGGIAHRSLRFKQTEAGCALFCWPVCLY